MIEDFCSIRRISGPQLSPSGKRVVFSVTDPHCVENRNVTHLYLSDMDGELRQLTKEGSYNGNPIWSPSESHIAYTSNLNGRRGLWKIKPDEEFPENIFYSDLSSPQWSPDSKKIKFLARVTRSEPKKSDVLVIRRLPYKFNGLGFLGNKWNHLFIADSSCGEIGQLTEGDYNVSGAKWRPDGLKIAYFANKSEDADITSKNDVYIIDLKSCTHDKITDGSRAFRSMSYSPDSKFLAVIGNTRKYGLATKNDIYVINIETGEEINLTKDFISKVGDSVSGGTGALARDPSPIWSNNSKYIYFLNAMHGNRNLYKVSLESKEVERISDPSMTIQSFSFSADQSKMAFLATDITSPSEIWVKDGKDIRKITHLNDKIKDNIELSKGEKFTFNASDNVPIECWFYKPIIQTEEKCPMVLLIKGGPHGSCWGNAFSLQAQILTAKGYAVLFTNERGTGGYGEDFAKTARAKFYGKREYQDIMEAIEYVVKNYPVDDKRLNVMGYSRGGFLTNWIITHSDKFNSAISAGGFSDVYSFFSTGDNIHIWCEKNYESTPWDDEELYMSKSPLRYVKKVTTPTMIMHAMEDYRAPLSQAEQLYVSLKRLRKETELVIFPGENHGLPRNSSPQHLMEYHQHVLRWFDQHNKKTS